MNRDCSSSSSSSSISNTTVTILMARIFDVLERIPLIGSNAQAISMAQNRSLDSIITGVVSKSVKRIDALLKTLRKKYDLSNGETDQWRLYLKEACETFQSSIPRNSLREPLPLSIACIKLNYEQMILRRRSSSNNVTASFCIVKGVDALILPKSPLAHDAIVQVASQFNFLESENEYHNNIQNYINDRTQGPRASLGVLSALLLRDACFRSSDQNSAFFSGIDCYKSGYFMPYKLSNQQQQKNILNGLRRKIDELNILAQWGIPDTGGSIPLMQVFTAAPSYQGNREPPQYSDGHRLCTLLVEAQYRAIAQIAVLRSMHIHKPVPLHLTLVGQGVFNNPQSVMKSAFKAVYDTVEGFNVKVYFHGFSEPDVMKIKNGFEFTGITLPIIDRDDFFRDQ